ncbi:ATPase [Chitinophaga caeni]|uniref:ATPase n=1 Tax=Chitinophaga caeni TaxID=2029983 RepID=A0A291QTA8_9BACT|nr:helicase HerA-like domain-containing protein [Chitinophaga caeni]ATL47112.1 ATPase [Chitinophaga caeni]
MANQEAFLQSIQNGYTFKGESFKLGCAMLEGQVIPGATVNLPLRMMNRHGLVAGATGTGKTKTIQIIAEGLSDASVPVLLMDIKGDLSGIAAKGSDNPKIQERYQKIGGEFVPQSFPTELLSLSNEKGVRLRATVSEFGPVLLSKILELNDTQAGLVAMLFKFCDDEQLPLLDLKDFKKVLQFASDEGKATLEKDYGKISTSSTGTILRKVIELEQQGADLFFGEKSFEVDDLMRINEDGRGMISILRVTDIQDRPKLFSTFMLSLLAELYATMPEEGDMDKPKLVMFIDEAHLIFQEASDALLQQIETIVKLIRSKGVGIFFCTQNPMDVPAAVLGQLGLKVQHALRAFTAKDRKTIKETAENYPLSDFYDTATLLTQIGTGEALITCLNEKGIPTPLAATMLVAPRSRMDILSEQEIDALISKSKLTQKYNQTIDNESAYEILSEKLAVAAKEEAPATKERRSSGRKKEEKSLLDSILSSSAARQATRTATNMITRSILGALGLGGKSSKKSSWF